MMHVLDLYQNVICVRLLCLPQSHVHCAVLGPFTTVRLTDTLHCAL